MKKFMKFLAAVCMMVFMCGVAVSADETAITTDVVVKTGAEDYTAYTPHSYTYGQNDLFTIGEKTYCGKIIPIYVSEPGKLCLAFNENQSLSTSVQVMLLTDRNSAIGSQYTYYSTASMQNKILNIDTIDAAGTYYIFLNSSSGYSSLTSNTVTFRSYVVSNSFGTVPASVTGKNQTVTYLPGAYGFTGQYVYIKYKAPATGYVTVKALSSGSADVTLCNKNKTAISTEDDWIYGSNSTYNTIVYGVKKNTTYYIRVKTSYDTCQLNIKTTTYKAASSGTKKSKATTLKSSKTYKGVIQAGSNTAKWYKFKVSKRKNVNIYFKGSTHGKFKITFYNSKGTKMHQTTVKANKFDGSAVGTNLKGTYYIKVQRVGKSSGYYTLKWK